MKLFSRADNTFLSIWVYFGQDQNHIGASIQVHWLFQTDLSLSKELCCSVVYSMLPIQVTAELVCPGSDNILMTYYLSGAQGAVHSYVVYHKQVGPPAKPCYGSGSRQDCAIPLKTSLNIAIHRL